MDSKQKENKHTERELRLKISLITLGLMLFMLSIPISKAYAQDDDEYRMEMGISLGGTFYNGDANRGLYGNLGIGGGFLVRRIINPRMAFKATLGYNGISGDTKNVNDLAPDNLASGTVSQNPLNYKFSGAIYDLNLLYELGFLPYGLKSGFLGNSRIVPFLQLGLGLSYTSVGKQATMNIPIGFGIKYKLAPRWNLGFDWTWHFTLSDNIDGLSEPHGIKGEMFKNKDGYCQTMLTVTYDLWPKCVTCNKD